MSFRRATARSRPLSAADLEARLEQEMRNPNTRIDAQPIVIAEPPDPDPITRLFVIWDDWADLGQQDRSEIITNAYEKAFGLPAAATLSVAMGLTSVDASRMGISTR